MPLARSRPHKDYCVYRRRQNLPMFCRFREEVLRSRMSLPPPKIFIVDDDDAVRDSLRMLLESHGMRVADYASAVDFARHCRPGRGDCLILDQHLPDLNGLDFLASREGSRLGISVILLTGRGDAAIRARAYVLGVSDYLEKPVSEEHLLPAIAKALGRARP
jgi:two-component system response regulator FixJ